MVRRESWAQDAGSAQALGIRGPGDSNASAGAAGAPSRSPKRRVAVLVLAIQTVARSGSVWGTRASTSS
jgi:hypothetical protein